MNNPTTTKTRATKVYGTYTRTSLVPHVIRRKIREYYLREGSHSIVSDLLLEYNKITMSPHMVKCVLAEGNADAPEPVVRREVPEQAMLDASMLGTRAKILRGAEQAFEEQYGMSVAQVLEHMARSY